MGMDVRLATLRHNVYNRKDKIGMSAKAADGETNDS